MTPDALPVRVGWNKLRAVPAVESRNPFELPERRGACFSLLLRLHVDPDVADFQATNGGHDGCRTI